MNIHPDAIVAIMMAVGFLFGYIFGRIERKEAATRMYRHGFHIGKAVGKANDNA